MSGWKVAVKNRLSVLLNSLMMMMMVVVTSRFVTYTAYMLHEASVKSFSGLASPEC